MRETTSLLFAFVAQCYHARGKTVWRDLNPHLHGTLCTAIRLHMPSAPDDIARIYRQFDGHYWFYGNEGAKGESLYSAAVEAGNTRMCESFERWKNRPAFLWPEETITPKRLHVGSKLTWQGQTVKVTSITGDKIVAGVYEKAESADQLWDSALNQYLDVIKRGVQAEDGSFTVKIKEGPRRERYDGRTPVKRYTITHAEMMAVRKAFDDERRKWEKLIAKADTQEALEQIVAQFKTEAGKLRHFDHDAIRAAFTKRQEAIAKAIAEAKREEERKAWAADEQKRRKKVGKEYDRLLPRWRAGEDVTLPWVDRPAALRIIGESVQDTHGHEVSLAAVRTLLPFVRLKRKIGWKATAEGKERRIDLHVLKQIDATGVTVGCMHFAWGEVDHLQNQLQTLAQAA